MKDSGLPQDAVPEAWQRTEEVRDLQEKNMALELNAKIFRRQTDIGTVEEGNEGQTRLQHSLQIYTTRTRHWDLKGSNWNGQEEPGWTCGSLLPIPVASLEIPSLFCPFKSCLFFIVLLNRSDVSLLCKDVCTEFQCQVLLLEAPGLLSLLPCFGNRVSW